MKRELIGFGFAVMLLASGGFIARKTAPQITTDPTDGHVFEAMEGSSTASVFGEFRTNMAGFLWLKADQYIHGGVALRSLTDDEHQANAIRRASIADGEANGTHDERNETTVIPESDRDFRGWLGEIERQTQPFYDIRGHKHHNPSETLPLIRFATWADPHFVPGFVVGANIIASDNTRVQEAIAYLNEGLRSNTRSIVILTELGRFYGYHLRQFDVSLISLDKAISIARSQKFRSEDDDEAFLNALRWKVLCLRQPNKQYQEALAVVEGLTYFPEDRVLQEMQKKLK